MWVEALSSRYLRARHAEWQQLLQEEFLRGRTARVAAATTPTAPRTREEASKRPVVLYTSRCWVDGATPRKDLEQRVVPAQLRPMMPDAVAPGRTEKLSTWKSVEVTPLDQAAEASAYPTNY